MSIFAWVIIGALSGWIASMIMGNNDRQGCITDIILGVIGAFTGGFLVGVITGQDFVAGFNISTIIVSVLGAVVVLAAWRMFTGRRVRR